MASASSQSAQGVLWAAVKLRAWRGLVEKVYPKPGYISHEGRGGIK